MKLEWIITRGHVFLGKDTRPRSDDCHCAWRDLKFVIFDEGSPDETGGCWCRSEDMRNIKRVIGSKLPCPPFFPDTVCCPLLKQTSTPMRADARRHLFLTLSQRKWRNFLWEKIHIDRNQRVLCVLLYMLENYYCVFIYLNNWISYVWSNLC